MGIDFYVFMIVFFFLLTVLILSFLGPENSENRFWIFTQKTRRIMDAVCYWFMTAMGIITLLFGIYSSIAESISTGKLNLSTAIILTVLCLICFECGISIRKEQKKGILCDCSGDCTNCKIQCRSNSKYYGLVKTGDEK